MSKERPDFITEEHLDFLDNLRESGATNMFGATPYIKDEYPDLSNKETKDLLLYWMNSFSERNS